ncbi:SubName: Full=Related to cytochrome P450 {ECO:0000313/EMBL:CCA66807.1} [Serendipita indica DSM 11827]|uniref:Related to cytochrome P450 n=2 Tax=Serendipita indica TaxID=65672 RepID=G4T6A0_SERID|nr:SubName: Full=Related to cytochrome P450 {ECO:0000313/EMBL:CCA66807.1} [Serendipita indica DSM 11827]CCA66807.1 related to cytochrome P450 [Serendipita indica DSM 11827]
MSLPLLIAAAIPVAIIALVIKTWWDRRFLLKNVAAPANASLIWGHEKTEFEDNQGWQWRAWFKECGKAFKIKGAWGHPDILVVGDTVALSHIYAKNTYNYPHSPVFIPLIERLTGRSLIWVEGERAHKKMRAMIAPAFSVENVRKMGGDIYHVANTLSNKLSNDILSNNGSVVVDATELAAPATLDVIGRVALGHDFGAVNGSAEGVKITQSWRAQNQMGQEADGFTAMLVLRLFPWITSLPLEAIKAQGAVAERIREIAKAIVSNGQIEKGGKDLMSILLRANANEDPNKRVDLAQIYDHVVTFIVAGHETTAGVTAFTLWTLATHPEIQNALRDELLAFPGEPTYDDFANLDTFPLLDAVCKENLRMFPASARNEKVAENDDILPLREPIKGADGSWIKSIPVKKGQVIHIPSIGINRDEDVWGDADVFRPSRWLVGRPGCEKYCKPGEQGLKPADEMCGGWAGIFTFSEGPRACVGMRLALFEYKVLIYTLVKHLVFEDTGAKIMTRFGATLAPRVVGQEADGIKLPVKISLA